MQTKAEYVSTLSDIQLWIYNTRAWDMSDGEGLDVAKAELSTRGLLAPVTNGPSMWGKDVPSSYSDG